MSTNILRSLFAGAAALLTSACTSTPSAPLKLSANVEPTSQQTFIFAQLRPDFQYFKGMWNDYRAEHGDGTKLDQQIQTCRDNPNTCSKLFQAWVKSIDAINELPKELPITRAQVAMNIIGLLMRPDDKKTTLVNALFHSGTWLKGPWEIFNEKNGGGGCGDYSIVLRETLLRIGMQKEEITLMAGMQPSGNFHFVDVLKVAKSKYILDSNRYEFLEPGDSDALASPIFATYEDYISGVEMKEGAIKSPPFSPLFEMGETFKIVGGFTEVVGTVLEPVKHLHMIEDIVEKVPKDLVVNTRNIEASLIARMMKIHDLIQSAREQPQPIEHSIKTPVTFNTMKLAPS